MKRAGAVAVKKTANEMVGLAGLEPTTKGL